MRCALLLSFLLACNSVGPSALPRDRHQYSTAVGRSWNRELLLNIVRLRYLDMPVFLDVQQILAGYTLEGAASAGWAENGLAQGWTVGGSGRYIDRPTITFRPRSGSSFARNIMTPIEPRAILYLIQSGFSADFVLPLCVSSINGLRNGSGTMTGAKQTDEGFARVVEIFSELQKTGELAMRVEKDEEDKRGALMIIMGSPDSSDEAKALARELGELLNLEAGQNRIRVEYSTRVGSGDWISMQTRSTLHIYFETATQIDAPPEHQDKGWVVPGVQDADVMRQIHIRSGKSQPAAAFISVQYADHWFWIEQSDLPSKRTFTFLNLLSAFVESSQPEVPTLVTVPG